MTYASKKNHTGEVNSTQGLESGWKTALWGTAAYTVNFQSNIYQKITYLVIYTSYVGSGLFEIFFFKSIFDTGQQNGNVTKLFSLFYCSGSTESILLLKRVLLNVKKQFYVIGDCFCNNT